jgi:hypothetical protein
MHCLYFVKVSKDEAESARQSINRAQSILEENNFAGENGGYWGGGKCDWFVMGGRWSGELSGLSIKGDFHNEVRTLVNTKEADGEERIFVSHDECKKYADDIQKLWLALGGKNANPYARDNYKQDGFDDDAELLSADLIATLKKKYPAGTEYYDSDGFEEKNISSLSANDIGDWLVVVDYHI